MPSGITVQPETATSSATGVLAGYIRESAGDTLNDAEREGQRLTIRRLADRDGFDPTSITFYDDWGYSGTRRDRPAYIRLRDDIGAGRIAVVYARSVDRLGRDEQEGIDFENLSRLHGVRVVTDRDGERTIDPDTQNVLVRYIPHLIAAEESRLGRARAREGRRTRLRNIEAHRSTCVSGNGGQDRRHWDGRPPYGVHPGESLQAVLGAFEEAGSYQGAARLLNARGVRPQRGRQWESTSVRRIVVRPTDAGGLGVRPPAPRRGRRTLATHLFAGLLTCPHDGSTLTASWRNVRGGRQVGYFCRVGRQSAIRCPEHGDLVVRSLDWTWLCPHGHSLARWDVGSDHPRPWSVPERPVYDWVAAATAAVLAAERLYEEDDDAAATISGLQDRRQRVVTAFVDGNLPEPDYRARLADIDTELGRLQASQHATDTWLVGIDWSQSTAVVNARLHDVLHTVWLGADMRPVGGVWKRRPSIGSGPEWGGAFEPHPDAIPVDGGWYLPFRVPDPRPAKPWSPLVKPRIARVVADAIAAERAAEAGLVSVGDLRS